jgi:hypothetical protein
LGVKPPKTKAVTGHRTPKADSALRQRISMVIGFSLILRLSI